MPIMNLMKYCLPDDFKLEEESDMLELLRDVRHGLISLDRSNRSTTLKDILKIVEEGELIVPGENYPTEVDLSNACTMLRNYEFMSKRGCPSCNQKGIHQPHSDETQSYCTLYEDKSAIDIRDGRSPRIEQFYNTGCEENTPRFRPIKEVLEEAKPY